MWMDLVRGSQNTAHHWKENCILHLWYLRVHWRLNMLKSFKSRSCSWGIHPLVIFFIQEILLGSSCVYYLHLSLTNLFFFWFLGIIFKEVLRNASPDIFLPSWSFVLYKHLCATHIYLSYTANGFALDHLHLVWWLVGKWAFTSTEEAQKASTTRGIFGRDTLICMWAAIWIV